MKRIYVQVLRVLAVVSLLGLMVSAESAAYAKERQQVRVTGWIDWGLYTDPDGCMYWYADGGLEGYTVRRYHPGTGKPYCMAKQTCFVEPEDVLFATDSARLTAEARRKLKDFLERDRSFSYAVYGNTDSRASDAYNNNLSLRRARAVARFARSLGAVVDQVGAFGEKNPKASNATAAGRQLNRRVQIVCYKLPE